MLTEEYSPLFVDIGLRFYINGEMMGAQEQATSFVHKSKFNSFRIGKSNSEPSTSALRMKFDQLVTWSRVLEPHDIERAFNDGRFQDQAL